MAKADIPQPNSIVVVKPSFPLNHGLVSDPMAVDRDSTLIVKPNWVLLKPCVSVTGSRYRPMVKKVIPWPNNTTAALAAINQ